MENDPPEDWRYPFRLQDDPYFGEDRESKRLENMKETVYRHLMEELTEKRKRGLARKNRKRP